ncbi:hypothetical protein [Polaromonas sp. CG9_12]|nr:hypothetical protein [Polaromonas sp. CG9_12]
MQALPGRLWRHFRHPAGNPSRPPADRAGKRPATAQSAGV